MPDNTQLAVAAGGDTIRTLDKTGTGAPKTEVVALDLGGGDGRSEYIGSYPLPVKLDDVPQDDDGNPLASLSQTTLDAIEMLFRQLIAAQGYPITTAEKLAGVTIVNAGYPPGSVDRYVNNSIPGSTPTQSGFNAAIAQALKGGAQVTFGATTLYLTTAPINCTLTGAPNNYGVVIRGVGSISHDLTTQTIIAKHTGVAVFDCTGNTAVQFYDVSIGTDATTYPQTGVLWARDNTLGGCVGMRMQNCYIIGSFSVACLYNYGAEQNTLIGNYFVNRALTAGTKTRVYTSNNVSGLVSPFVAIATGALSCIEHNCFGNNDQNLAGTATTDCVYLEGAGTYKSYGGWAICGTTVLFTGTANQTAASAVMTVTAATAGALAVGQLILGTGVAAGTTISSFGTGTGGVGTYNMSNTTGFASTAITGGNNGRALVYVDLTTSTSDGAIFHGLRGEYTGSYLQAYGILFSNTALTPTGWNIDSCRLPNVTQAIAAAGTSPILDSFYISNLTAQTGGGISVPGTLQNATIDTENSITIGTSNKNQITCVQTSLTITNFTNTAVIDKVTGSIYNQSNGALFSKSPVGAVSAQMLLDTSSANGCFLDILVAGATSGQFGSAKSIVASSFASNDMAIGAGAKIVFATAFSATPVLQMTTANDMIGRGVAFCLRATAIETRTSTVTLTNSTQLTYAIPVAGTYAFEIVLFSYFTTAVTNGITANVNYSGTFTAVGSYLCGSFCNGTTTDVAIQPVAVSATVNNALAGLTLATYGASVTSAAPAVHKIRGNLIATGTGTLALAFAQASSGVNTANLGVGSYMTVTQLS